MKTKAVVLASVFLVAFGLLGAPKARDWQIGKLTDSRTVDTGVKPKQPHFSVGPSAPPPSSSTITVTTAELSITGAGYIFTVRDADSKKPCRYIVGDNVKYVQDKLLMYLIDADGTECKGQIMKQERVPPAAPTAVTK